MSLGPVENQTQLLKGIQGNGQMSIRWALADAQCAKMELCCRGKPSDPGRSGKDNRLFVEALWIARTDIAANEHRLTTNLAPRSRRCIERFFQHSGLPDQIISIDIAPPSRRNRTE